MSEQIYGLTPFMSLGALEDMPSDEIEQAVSQADANTAVLNEVSTVVNGTASGLDTLGSPLVEEFTEDQVNGWPDGLSQSPQVQSSSTGK